jgi:hypothetical protein
MSPMTYAWCVTLFTLAMLLPSYAASQSRQSRADLGGLSSSLQAVAARVAPAVVQIQVAAYGPVSAATTGPAALIGTRRAPAPVWW